MRLGTWSLLFAVLLAGCSRETAEESPAPLPPASVIEIEDAGFADQPSVAQVLDGSLYVAWISFRDGIDTLQIARYRRDEESFTPEASWLAAGRRGLALLGPKVVAAGDDVFVVYAGESNDNWDIYAIRCTLQGPEAPVRITTHADADVKPDAVYRDGHLAIVWEASRDGRRTIQFSLLVDGSPQVVEPVSEAGFSNYSPAITSGRTGDIAIAWHSWRDSNYDIYFRQRQPSGRWSVERRLTSAAVMDRNATLAVHRDDVWLAYEIANTEGYATGQMTTRRIAIAKVTPDGLRVPEQQLPTRIQDDAEAPALAFDAGGRLWLAFLKPAAPQEGEWAAYLAGFTSQGWTESRRITDGKGLDRTPSLAIQNSEVLVALQIDDFPGVEEPLPSETMAKASSRVTLAAIDFRNTPPAAPFVEVAPLEESRESFEAARLRRAYGEDQPAASLEYRGRVLQLYYGDLHAHTDIAGRNPTPEGSLDEAYQTRRDVNRVDFVAISDHDYLFTPYLWSLSAKMVRANEDRGTFVPFLAQEWTSGTTERGGAQSAGESGHRNLIFADPYLPRWWSAHTGQTPPEVWSELRAMRADFVMIPHQLADSGARPVAWSYVDERAQPVAEIFHSNGSYEAFGAPRQAPEAEARQGHYLQDAWERGTIIGVVASPGHGGGVGKAAVWADVLTRQGILDAIRARRTFGTTGVRMMLDVRVNGYLMGEKAPAAEGPVEVLVRAAAPAEIARIEICRNNQFIHTMEPKATVAELRWQDSAPEPDVSYYYVRVTLADGEMAWSSPVWVGAE